MTNSIRQLTPARAPALTDAFFSVRADRKSWSRYPITINEFLTRGFEVHAPRHCGEYDLYYDRRKVAVLFASAVDAAAFQAGGKC